MNWCVLKINLFIAFLVVLFETLILLEKHIAMLQENKGQSEMNKQFKWRFYSNLIRFYVLIHYFVQLCIKSNQRQFTLIYLVYVSCTLPSFTFFTNKQKKDQIQNSPQLPGSIQKWIDLNIQINIKEITQNRRMPEMIGNINSFSSICKEFGVEVLK